jgi:hypothetical protein
MRPRSTFAAIALAALALAGLALPAGAPARATVQRFEFTNSYTDTVDETGTCLGAGAVGTIAVDEHVSGQFTNTYDGDPDPGGPRGFHSWGTDARTYRIDFADGRYILASGVTHFDYDDNPNQLRTNYTEATRDSGTLYAAGGQALGAVTVHATFHFTFSDANGNTEPDPGELTAFTDRFSLTCP